MTRRRTPQRASRRKPAIDTRIRHEGPNMAALQHWRQVQRPRLLRRLASRTADLKWSLTLLRPLLEELYVNEVFEELVGPLHCIPIRRYPHAVAVALVLRHSWRPDDLRWFAKELGINLRV
jgi:hypothetical protein